MVERSRAAAAEDEAVSVEPELSESAPELRERRLPAAREHD